MNRLILKTATNICLLLVMAIIIQKDLFAENSRTFESDGSVQTQELLSESFDVSPGELKDYSWNFPSSGGTLKISVSTNSAIAIYVVDEVNFWKLKAGERFMALANKRNITSSNFNVKIPKEGNYKIVVSNREALLATASVSLEIVYIP